MDPVGDAWLRPRVEAACRFVVDAVGEGQVQGLVLTGSLSRGEASVFVGSGSCRLLGDVEFLLLVPPQRHWRAFRRRVADLGRKASDRIGDGDGRFTVEYTPADVSYLAERARPSMFTIDLRQHGRVVFGDLGLVGRMPAFDRSDIPPGDAVETLMNRGIELLALEDEDETETTTYAVAKTLLDMAGSALAFSGVYESLYSRRPEALCALLAGSSDLADAVRSPAAWLAAVKTSADLKLRPTAVGLRAMFAAVDPAQLRRWLIDLWRWEVGGLLGRRGKSVPELVSAYLAADAPAARLRGWAKYIWHPLRPASAPIGLRDARLAATAGPRRLIYAAAILAIDRAPGWETHAARLLPVLPMRTTVAEMRRAIVEAWTWLIRNN